MSCRLEAPGCGWLRSYAADTAGASLGAPARTNPTEGPLLDSLYFIYSAKEYIYVEKNILKTIK